MADSIIADDVVVEEDVVIGHGCTIYPNTIIKAGTTIYPHCMIGEPQPEFFRTGDAYHKHPTVIGNNNIIRPYTNISEGVTVGDNCHFGERVLVRNGTLIGDNVGIGNLCDLQADVTIGDHTRLHSNVHLGRFTTLGNYVWIFPYAVFTNDPYPPHGNLQGSTVYDYSMVAVHCTVMPGITIGKNSLLGSHSLLTKNIEEDELWVGSPAKFKCNLSDVKGEGDEALYPWKEHLKVQRGYPWQT